ncbi:ABC transporter substrate-binding protein [Specibacter sp. RAF43]|uniref:ABC transporter substrate-binding protein n=1 Tax=Specibacter sp. RAF43 TaxID=3233057 RepID=UPI003F96D120
MPQPIDVGSILGGRYKVTGRILASAENDVILDGLDQVLNRPVSILVSAVDNSSNLTQSAREVATGERVSNVSILDMGTQDDSTYLIASRTTPADLLDLVVPTEVAEDPYGTGEQDVYQEPFFTDTLGTEIFGSARDAAPNNGPYVYEDDSPLTPGHPAPPAVGRRPPAAPSATRPATAPAARTPTTGKAAANPATTPAPAVPQARAGVVPPTAAAATVPPKVTLWNENDFEAGDGQPTHKAGTFPADVRAASDNFEDLDEDDDINAPRSGGRWLTGAIVAVLVVAALFFAVTHISTLFNGSNTANSDKSTSQQTPSTTGAQQSASTPAAPPAVAPGIAGLTQYTPDDPSLGQQYFPRLKDAIDNNKGTYWPTLEFSNDSFAGMTDSINLVVALKEESTISSVTINQIAGSGGQFNILTNSRPVLDGAAKIGSGSFSAPDFTLKAAPGVKAKYVIINFTQLPKLQPFRTYPYGLKIAEISIK